jgi:uncharacterized protein YcnI
MKYVGVIIGMLAMMFVLAGKVSAHVTLQPKEAVVGYTVSSVRVPNEKDVPTVKVHVLVPEGATVHGIKPVEGWQYSVVREEPKEDASSSEDHHAAEGRITEITWTGGKIGVGEFMEFPLSVQYAASVESVTWKAHQTYADGEVVPWDGSDEGHPAPVVTVLKEAKVDTLVKSLGTTAPVTTAAQSSWMSVAALLVSALALAVSMKKK